MKENLRRCSKCGCSTNEDPSIALHRFPKPGRTNSLRCEMWAKYCFPHDSWSSIEFQHKLHSRHLMLCTKHFNTSSFIDGSGKRLVKSAVPDMKYDKVVLADPNLEPININLPINSLHPQVKLESFQETVPVKTYSKFQSEPTDRLSGGEEQSNDSAESSGGEDVNDDDSNTPALQNLYPQWLVEVEKKRADAELIRAKAEEQRVAVAAKNAEAAVIQAEALKMLAEAANTQAEAILRIAVVLETRGQRDMLSL